MRAYGSALERRELILAERRHNHVHLARRPMRGVIARTKLFTRKF